MKMRRCSGYQHAIVVQSRESLADHAADRVQSIMIHCYCYEIYGFCDFFFRGGDLTVKINFKVCVMLW